jgi:hypothetical protein
MNGLVRVMGIVALLAAGCAGGQAGAGTPTGGEVPETGPSNEVTPSPTTAVPSASAVPESVPGPISGPPLHTTTGQPAPAPGGACTAPASVRITAGALPEPVCLPINGMLRLTADPSPHQPWGKLVSSNPKILSCTSEAGAQGEVSGVCTPHLPGTVTVSTMTAPFAGDPHGPPQYRWELRVTVVAYGMN